LSLLPGDRGRIRPAETVRRDFPTAPFKGTEEWTTPSNPWSAGHPCPTSKGNGDCPVVLLTRGAVRRTVMTGPTQREAAWRQTMLRDVSPRPHERARFDVEGQSEEAVYVSEHTELAIEFSLGR
jgi:hypothetical protein